MPRPFLTARWEDLALITYAIDPALAARHLPADCEPDLLDGQARVSLVAFQFKDARVFGRRWPGHTHFPEVNLRLYARRGGERGVVFVSEFVPRRAITFFANLIYNEQYSTLPMTGRTRRDERGITIDHTLMVRGRRQTIRVEADLPAAVPGPDEEAAWVKEQHWGFGQSHFGRPLSYQVHHPTWATYQNVRATLAFDFDYVYGREWAFLNDAEPVSVVLAAGSEVAIYPKQIGRGSGRKRQDATAEAVDSSVDEPLPTRQESTARAVASEPPQGKTTMPNVQNGPLVLFDGSCHLCRGSVRFMQCHQRPDRRRLSFAALGSDTATQALVRHGFPADFMESVVLIERDRAYTESTAAWRMAAYLTLPWRAATAARLLPKPLRDAAYHWISEHRHALPGPPGLCRLH